MAEPVHSEENEERGQQQLRVHLKTYYSGEGDGGGSCWICVVRERDRASHGGQRRQQRGKCDVSIVKVYAADLQLCHLCDCDQ